MSGKRRKPWIVQKTIGWEWDEARGKNIQKLATIGYAATKAEGIQMLAEYNNNPFDIKASKITFQEVYERWSKENSRQSPIPMLKATKHPTRYAEHSTIRYSRK